MKFIRALFLLGLLGLAIAPAARAQVYLHTQDVTGDFGTGVVARFYFEIDIASNTLTIRVDNTVAINAQGLGTKGTIVSFGFNTPFTGLRTSDVDTTVVWNKRNTGHTQVSTTQRVINGSSSSFWEEHAHYTLAHQGTKYDQDFGVSTKDTPSADAAGLDNVNQGIRYGEIATFTFKFKNHDITEDNYKDFFGDNYISVYWREVTETYTVREKNKFGQWKDVTKTRTPNGGWDKGMASFRPPSDGDLPATPEPSTYGLMGAAALLGLIAHRRHKAKKAAETA
jgi:PEP-CTERM putative exosortase interaction domain